MINGLVGVVIISIYHTIVIAILIAAHMRRASMATLPCSIGGFAVSSSIGVSECEKVDSHVIEKIFEKWKNSFHPVKIRQNHFTR